MAKKNNVDNENINNTTLDPDYGMELDQQVDLSELQGKYVWLWCVNYIYNGKLVAHNKFSVKLEDACVVFETGNIDAETFTDYQNFKKPLYVRTSAIESFSESGRTKLARK